MSGPLSKNTSHSRMQAAKKHLLGQEQFKGGEAFLQFGDALHKRWLVNSHEYRLTEQEHQQITEMVEALNKHAVAKSLLKDATVEQKKYTELQGVLIAYILDIQKHKVGADLKTTSCRTKADFERKAKEYGYFEQAEVYMEAEKLREFYFIGICKQKPYNVYILDVRMHQRSMRYAKKEIEFLLYFYKHYGNVIPEQERVKDSIIETNANTMTGKEALKEITKLNKAWKDSKKAADKAADKLNKTIGKFPKKELELYNEKLEQLKAQ